MSAPAAEPRRQVRFCLSSNAFGRFTTLFFVPRAIEVGILSSLTCRMAPAFGMPLQNRKPDCLHPLLLSWAGQVMPREERASS